MLYLLVRSHLKGEDRVAIIHKHLSQLPDSPEKISKDLNPELGGFITNYWLKIPMIDINRH